MPRQEHILTIFAASPGDVDDERTILEEIISELNVMWSRDLGIRLDLVRWETHAYPGVGEDAQAVINEQIPDDYDLFVGIMWCRYGTPTGRAGSGTVEEFERAKARYDSDPTSVKLMIYFKDEAIPPSRLDTSQLAKVNEFRQSLGKEGVLYWNFTNQEQYEKLLRLHLTRQVQAWKTRLEQQPLTNDALKSVDQEEEKPTENSLDDDLGLLDLMEIVEERFEQLANISERIATATGNLGIKMNQRTDQINQLPRDSQGSANRKAAKRLIAMAASDLEEYTARMEAELPIFNNSLNEGMNALISSSSMSLGLVTKEEAAEMVKEGLEATSIIFTTLTTSKESITEFRGVIASLPSMTSKLNKAKRGVVSVLDKLIGEFSNGQSLLRESEEVVHGFLQGENND
ncbi:hypothetical protein ACFL6N_02545 [Thermodesulfobacteriota bacterium]